MIIQQQEEDYKRSKLQREKPQAYQKICKFQEKLDKGESITILQFQFDYACNFNCSHCSIANRANPNRKKLGVQEVKDIARQAEDLGLARWVFTGGEPLVSKHLEPFINAIDPNKWYISCDSNCWYLDKDKAKYLKSLGIDRMQPSIDGLDDQEHDSFRRMPGSFQRCMRALDYIQEAGMDLFVQTVVTKARLHSQEFISFLDYFTKRDISVFVSFAKPVGNFEGNLDCIIDSSDLAYFNLLERNYKVFSHLTQAYGYDMGCPAVKGITTITPYGDVLGCQYMPITIGNLRDESLKDILERGLSIKWFGEHVDTCPAAADREFIQKYIIGRTYGKEFPVPWYQVFKEEDLTKRRFNER